MNCKDCIHFDVCCVYPNRGQLKDCDFSVYPCGRFKDKSKIIELPCRVGDTVYLTDGKMIYSVTVCGIFILGKVYFETETVTFDQDAIGESIFLTREAAETALANYNKL